MLLNVAFIVTIKAYHNKEMMIMSKSIELASFKIKNYEGQRENTTATAEISVSYSNLRTGGKACKLHLQIVQHEAGVDGRPGFTIKAAGKGCSLILSEATRFGKKRLEREAADVTRGDVESLVENLITLRGYEFKQEGLDELNAFYESRT